MVIFTSQVVLFCHKHLCSLFPIEGSVPFSIIWSLLKLIFLISPQINSSGTLKHLPVIFCSAQPIEKPPIKASTGPALNWGTATANPPIKHGLCKTDVFMEVLLIWKGILIKNTFNIYKTWILISFSQQFAICHNVGHSYHTIYQTYDWLALLSVSEPKAEIGVTL